MTKGMQLLLAALIVASLLMWCVAMAEMGQQ